MANRSIVVGGEEIKYVLARSKGVKRLKIVINSLGNVTVRANKSTAIKDIESFIISNAEWIHKVQAKKRSEEVHFCTGATAFYAGKRYTLSVHQGQKARMELSGDIMNVYVLRDMSEESVRRYLRLFYTQEAMARFKRIFNEVLNECETMDRRRAEVANIVSKFIIFDTKSVRSYLGKCFCSKRKIVLSLYLAVYDDEIVRSVIFHELAHLTQANHSAKFYEVVERLMPSYMAVSKRMQECKEMMLFSRYLFARHDELER